MGKLPTFRGYTVDFRLREFRRAQVGKGIESIPFASPKGERLLAAIQRRSESDSGDDVFTQLKRHEEALYAQARQMAEHAKRLIEQLEQSDHPLKHERVKRLKQLVKELTT